MVGMARPPVPEFHLCGQQTRGLFGRGRLQSASLYHCETRTRNLAPGFRSTDEMGTSRSLSQNGSQKARTPQKLPSRLVCDRRAFSDSNIGCLGFPTSTGRSCLLLVPDPNLAPADVESSALNQCFTPGRSLQKNFGLQLSVTSLSILSLRGKKHTAAMAGMRRKGLMTSDVRGLLSLMAFRLRGFRAKITYRPFGL
jgi:hypothetical protein